MQEPPRRFRTFIQNRGVFTVDVDRDPPERVATLLERLVEAGYWQELDRFPKDAVARSLPHLHLPRATRHLVETWVRERIDGEAVA